MLFINLIKIYVHVSVFNREDLDSLIELSLWPGDRDPMQVVDSKVCYISFSTLLTSLKCLNIERRNKNVYCR